MSADQIAAMAAQVSLLQSMLNQAQAAAGLTVEQDDPRPNTTAIYARLRYFCGPDCKSQLYLFKSVCLLDKEPEAYPDEELDICLHLLSALEVH